VTMAGLALALCARPACAQAAAGPAAEQNGLIRQGAYLVCGDDHGGVHVLFDGRPVLHDMGIYCGLNGYTRFEDLVETSTERGPGRVTFRGQVRGTDVAFEQTVSIDGGRVRVRIRRTGAWPADTWGGFQVRLPASRFGGARYGADGQAWTYPAEYSPESRFAGGMRRFECHLDEPRLNLTFECADGIGLGDHRRFGAPFYVASVDLPKGERDTAEFFITLPQLPDVPPRQAVRWCHAGYPLAGEKFVVLEWAGCDPRPDDRARLEDRQGRTVKEGRFGPTEALDFVQGNYATFDFSDVRTPGDYRVVWSGGATGYFPIRLNAFEDRLWQPTLDYFLPFQMCHASVDLGDEVTGHPRCHADDAARAPYGHKGPDGFRSYEAGPAPHGPGEHVPLDVGGWHDAGDYDVNVHAQGFCVWTLALAYEEFGIERDVATLDAAGRSFTAGRPDGTPDLLQQVEWGALWLLKMQQPDGLVYAGVCGEPAQRGRLALGQVTDGRPGTGDERYVYVDYHPDVQLVQAVALAAAARVLGPVRPALTDRCVQAARAALRYFQEHEEVYRGGGGYTADQVHGKERDAMVMAAAIELYLTTHEAGYLDIVRGLAGSLPELEFKWPLPRRTGNARFWYCPSFLVRLHQALPDGELKATLEATIRRAAQVQAGVAAVRPWPFYWYDFGKWGNSGVCTARAFDTYWLSKVAPDLLPPSSALRAMMWLYGLHPAGDTTFVTGLGLPGPQHLYSSHLHALFGYEPAGVPGALVPGMGGFWRAGVLSYMDEHGNYGHNEACIYTQAQYVFAVNAMKAMGF